MMLFKFRAGSKCAAVSSQVSAVVMLGLMSSAAFAAPTARITASRVSGPAPLAVHFDATGTTDSDASVNTFRQLGYRFTFGDAASGTWTYSGLPKNEQIGGPLAAHVFDRAGTYTVQVTARNASGAQSTATVTINVQSPEEAFPGTRTVCLSRTSDFTGCPSGADQRQVSSWPSTQNSTRYLLRAGQDFTSFGRFRLVQGNGSGLTDVQVNSFGSGAKPLTGEIFIDSGDAGDTEWPRRVVVANLNASGMLQYKGSFDLLIYRNDVLRGGSIWLADAFDWFLENQPGSSWKNPENNFVVDNVVNPNYAVDGITGRGTRLVLMGNSVDRTEQHNSRLWQGHKAVVAHNSFTGRIGDMYRCTIKFHSRGLDPIQSTLALRQPQLQRSSQLVISDNRFGSDSSNIQWLAASAPQNGASPEGIEDVIWEDNQFRHGANFARDITWAGRRITERGNRNVTDNRAVSTGLGHNEALPSDWQGPYYVGQPSVKGWFAGQTIVLPRSPSALRVE